VLLKLKDDFSVEYTLSPQNGSNESARRIYELGNDQCRGETLNLRNFQKEKKQTCGDLQVDPSSVRNKIRHLQWSSISKFIDVIMRSRDASFGFTMKSVGRNRGSVERLNVQ